MCYRCVQSISDLIGGKGSRRNSWAGEPSFHASGESGGYLTHYTKLAMDDAAALLSGTVPYLVSTRMGMKIGGGAVYPKLNFTPPSLEINKENWSQVRTHYERIISSGLLRAAQLECPGVIVEFEALPPMMEYPEWGLEIAQLLLNGMEKAYAEHGLKSVLRMTPNDNRGLVRPPQLRSGYHLDRMVQLFESAAVAGVELLSIESVGGREIHDKALMDCDISQVIFALCILGARDMEFLWSKLHDIALRHRVHCAGDSACAFGNKALLLAGQEMIPRVFATVVCAVTAVRSLVAYECGAVGPGKDCGYENIILKAITGCPMVMGGKATACAHLNKDSALTLRRRMAASDAGLDPQTFILTPENAIALAKVIVDADSRYHAGKVVALEAIRLMREAHLAGKLTIVPHELPWLDRLEKEVSDLSEDENKFISDMMEAVDASKYCPEEYGLKKKEDGRPNITWGSAVNA